MQAVNANLSSKYQGLHEILCDRVRQTIESYNTQFDPKIKCPNDEVLNKTNLLGLVTILQIFSTTHVEDTTTLFYDLALMKDAFENSEIIADNSVKNIESLFDYYHTLKQAIDNSSFEAGLMLAEDNLLEFFDISEESSLGISRSKLVSQIAYEFAKGDAARSIFDKFENLQHSALVHAEDLHMLYRNIAMLDKILPTFKEGEAILFTGNAHCQGENGFLNMLRKQGFTIKRIYDSPYAPNLVKSKNDQHDLRASIFAAIFLATFLATFLAALTGTSVYYDQNPIDKNNTMFNQEAANFLIVIFACALLTLLTKPREVRNREVLTRLVTEGYNRVAERSTIKFIDWPIQQPVNEQATVTTDRALIFSGNGFGLFDKVNSIAQHIKEESKLVAEGMRIILGGNKPKL